MSLAQSMVMSSDTPLLLLDIDLVVLAASASFCRAFKLEQQLVTGTSIFSMGRGEWDLPRLRSLLTATVLGGAEILQYEMDLVPADKSGSRCLELSAHVLSYEDRDNVRVLLSVVDTTDIRLAEKLKDGLIAKNVLLMQELQHRVANSLQIIASVLMQSARRVANEETRDYLQTAQNRVLSVATIQKHLSSTGADKVELRPYLSQLCHSLGASMIAFPEELSISVDCDDTVVSSDKSISFGLIVTELVINSLKHAFPEDFCGSIIVTFNQNADGWTLKVQDDGVGMPTGKAAPKAGLGTSIVEALSRQLQARSSVTNLNPGTFVTIAHQSAAVAGVEALPLTRAI
ncbi:sensor histidine kinase [Allopontixanthobacter sp.]|uniref:sensor histidine kinase n=1 Tax=Allopontixanthobacter sp. TaxID=2906452 RepID=UPI002ABCFC70|nr:sensor histidine kinase [Allopontixanthobacter sp.]MDZ4306646.1 sensor histidine kinase [Allopontixanthobacter sp.]